MQADGAGSVTRMQGEGRNESTRLGFRGVEDIGGGWGAAFWLEAGLFVDSGIGSTSTGNNTSYGQTAISNGTNNSNASPDLVTQNAQQGLTFNRAATVSLINKDMGEFRLGRDYTPTFWNKTQFDPFGTVGSGSYTNLTYGTLNKYVARVVIELIQIGQIARIRQLIQVDDNFVSLRKPGVNKIASNKPRASSYQY